MWYLKEVVQPLDVICLNKVLIELLIQWSYKWYPGSHIFYCRLENLHFFNPLKTQRMYLILSLKSLKKPSETLRNISGCSLFSASKIVLGSDHVAVGYWLLQCNFTLSRLSILSTALVTNIETEVMEMFQQVCRDWILANLGGECSLQAQWRYGHSYITW